MSGRGRGQSPLERQVWTLMSGYVRVGSKAYHRLQRNRAMRWARHASALGVRCLNQAGRAQVMSFWARQDLSRLAPKTRDEFWDAIVTLWQLAGLDRTPPRPPDTLRGHGTQA